MEHDNIDFSQVEPADKVLREACKREKIPGYSKMNKAQKMDALKSCYLAKSAPAPAPTPAPVPTHTTEPVPETGSPAAQVFTQEAPTKRQKKAPSLWNAHVSAYMKENGISVLSKAASDPECRRQFDLKKPKPTSS